MNEREIEMLLDELRDSPPDSVRYQRAIDALNGVHTTNYKEIDDETL